MVNDAYAALQATLGGFGSARRRYAAAMAPYNAGQISTEVLEVYRSCASLDGQDPLVLFVDYGLQSPVAAFVISSLLAEIDKYLATLNAPGIADVRQGIAAAPYTKILSRTPVSNPVISSHLDTAPDATANQILELVASIRAASPHLRWVTYDGYHPQCIGTDYAQGHAFTLLLGQDAPIAAKDFDLGLFLIALNVFYRDHNHAAPELDAPLTGRMVGALARAHLLLLKPSINRSGMRLMHRIWPKSVRCRFCAFSHGHAMLTLWRK